MRKSAVLNRAVSELDGGTRPVPAVGWQDLIRIRAHQHPHRTAVVAGDGALSFAEVERYSARLARLLREAGAQPGTVVACAMTRSALAVLALLAVAKAGAIYLPLDPALPPARRDAIMAEADPAVVLTDIENVPADVVLTTQNWRHILTTYAPYVGDGSGADDPAYVIYTSGSTGRPKGVDVAHRSLVNLHGELTARLFPRRPRRVAHGLPLAFDAAWNPLLWMAGGHELHLVPDDIRADPDAYTRFLRAHRIGVLEAVPAHMTALLDAGVLEGEQHPELLLMGGEAIGQGLWSRLRAARGITAVNLYGPTECTVFTTTCLLAERETPSIGHPIANTQIRVTGSDGRPVPLGEPGELLVGGTCLAQGYLGDDTLTRTRFGTAPRRWYRTGDRCRIAPDGALEWLGRLDDQIKIRGHRIEPGETEHALRALPGVRQAIVRAEGSGTGRHLAAYVVLEPDSRTDLHNRLRALLPDHQVPSSVTTVDVLPLGPHGKVDRTAVHAPLTPEQDVIAAAFRAQLGIGAVAADSDFFALGGHSLTAAALAARLRAAGVQCSLRDVLRLRTVARLAELVPTRQARSGTS